MPWTPRYAKARYARPLIDNLATIFKANAVEALAWANRNASDVPQAGIATFVEPYQYARRINTKFPSLSIVIAKSDIIESEDGAALKEDHTIQIILEELSQSAQTDDLNALADRVAKRAAAIDMMIRSAAPSALYAGYATSKIKRPYFEITPHDYRDFTNAAGSLYRRTATVTVTFYNLFESL